MAPLNAVKILQICPVAPPDSPAQSSLPLTFFDATPSSLNSNTLSLTLHHFLPLAGTIVWPPTSAEPFIRIDANSALQLTIAESDADFHHLSGNNFRDSAEYHPLVPTLPVSEVEARVMAVQITLFSGTGFSIGITSHHAALDSRAAALFVKAWASLCKLGGASLPPELTPFYGRADIGDPKGIKQRYLDGWEKSGGPNANRSLTLIDEFNAPSNTIRGTFMLRPDDIEKLRERVGQTLIERKKKKQELPRLSTFVLTCAYVWVCLVKAEGLESKDGLAHTCFLFSADCRGRLEPPIPATYFGNCVGGGFARVKVGDVAGEDGVAVAAEAIGEGVSSLNNGGLYEHLERLLSHGPFPDKSEKWITVAGSPQFELYMADFGWGRARRIEVVSVDRTGAVALSESGDGRSGGIEIGLALSEEKMEVFASLFVKEALAFFVLAGTFAFVSFDAFADFAFVANVDFFLATSVTNGFTAGDQHQISDGFTATSSSYVSFFRTLGA
ncbi:malonyl-CoA:anthocyanidin 5-O-glucoside-6''-O-malonyltransferase-like [Malania oleifera]|uniref:malonyl-CoA:anthocyanidin 5-O-glucoside-6''-O-malonyltransferase-like n=1 Tax=Malania oleifera TaxID=397392 RepID=UPI0025AEB03D|nr:malonyl-CoA:anthocyanidin 5-O-glucoside-6''-O-malonyltransferase-like [Malania oleifera]